MANPAVTLLDRLARAAFARDAAPSVHVPWWLRVIFALAGGTCVFLSFPDFNQFYLAYVALALEMWAVEGLRPRRAFLVGWLAGSCTNIGGFYWVGSLLHDFGHMPTWLSMTLCIALGIVQGLVFGIWPAIVRRCNARSVWWTAVPAFVLVEMFFPMIFPWFYANSQYNFPIAVQTADIFGVLGVSALLVTCNVLLFDVTRTWWLRRRDRSVPWNRRALIGAAIVIAAAFVYAPIRMAQIDAIDAESPRLKVGMVEGDVGIWETEPPQKRLNNLFIHHSLSHQLTQEGVDLLVWPESSYIQGLIWGSTRKTDDPVEHEIDALYADWFHPTAALVYHTVDAAFGPAFHRNPAVRKPLELAINEAARNVKFANIDRYQDLEVFYRSLVQGYYFPCDETRQIRRCPYVRLTPDDLTYYLPSAEPLRESREADLKYQIRPEDIASPVRDFDTAVIFGTLTIASKTGEPKPFAELYRATAKERKLFNTAHLVAPDGRVLGVYHKNYPLIFGEYIPFEESFPWLHEKLQELIKEAGNLTAGDEMHTWNYRGFELAPIICYEDILPRFVRDFSRLTPNAFVNVTNDAWFGKTAEPMLHLALAMMRTVEHRRWLIRSTNTGVSAFVDANGRMVSHTSIYDPETLVASVAMMPRTRTIYSYIGDILGWLALAWFVLLALAKRRMRKQADEAPTDVAAKSDESAASDV